MSHFEDDIHHRVTTRLNEIIPYYVETEYPAFVSFLRAYYEFLEQTDRLPIAPTYAEQLGVVTVLAGNSAVSGLNTEFLDSGVYANNKIIRVGAETFRIRSIANNTQLTIYDIPKRTYFGNSHSIQINTSIRQAKGAAHQILTFHDIADTLDDFIVYFRDTYLRNIPQGLTDTATLLPRILDFYQSRGSEASYQFLFQSLYGKSVKFSYPRDSVFTTSDNDYIVPVLMRIDYDSIIGNVSLLETRDIIGLTSNARATVLQTAVAYEGSTKVLRVFIDEQKSLQIPGNILLETGERLLVTTYGIPPEGLSTKIYTFSLIQELVQANKFQPGETISTLPLEDSFRITGTILGSITGYTVNQRGVGYQVGDLIYPPQPGSGASGRVSQLAAVDLTDVIISEPGVGYYENLPLTVDNSGTGGNGFAGYVSKITSGNISLHQDDSLNPAINNGDRLIFQDENENTYIASLEKVDYYQVGVSLAEVLNPDGNNATSDSIVINTVPWSSNSLSALYNISLSTQIIDVISQLSTFPLYVKDFGDTIGRRIEIGEISEITIQSPGTGYLLNTPRIGVKTPQLPTKDIESLLPLTYEEIFGVGFQLANVAVTAAAGQLEKIDVITGGSGYTTAPFFVNSTTSTTTTGDGEANISPVLGAINYGVPRFKNTRSFTSADQYLQDITKYQPFSYVLTVEEDLYRYRDTLIRLVHPAGGLLLPQQTITTDVDLTVGTEQLITFPIQLNALTTTIIFESTKDTELYANYTELTDTNSVEVTAAQIQLYVTYTESVDTNIVEVIASEEDLHIKFPIESNAITVTGDSVKLNMGLPVQSNAITVTGDSVKFLKSWCWEAIEVTVPSTTVRSLETTHEDPHAPSPSCAYDTERRYHTAWYKVNLDAGKNYTIHTLNSTTHDTLLSLWSGSCGTLVEEACSEDAGQDYYTENLSIIEYPCTTSGMYYVQISSYLPRDSGNYVLNISESETRPQSACEDAIEVAVPSSTARNIETLEQDINAPSPSCAYDSELRYYTAWYKVDLEAGKRYVVHTLSSTTDDTLLSLWSGSCGALVEEACSEDYGEEFLSYLVYDCTTTGTYYVQISDYYEYDTGNYVLNIYELPSQILCSNAVAIAVPSTTTRSLQEIDAEYPVGSKLGIDPDAPCPSCAYECEDRYHTAWYEVNLEVGKRYAIHTLNSSSYDTLLSLWSGSCGALVEEACSEDYIDEYSFIEYNCAITGTYYVQISSAYSYDYDDYVLKIYELPAEGLCVNAIDVAVPSITTVTLDTTYEDPDAPCPSCAYDCERRHYTAWFKVDLEAGKEYTIHTLNSTTYDTLLSVWSGSCGALVEEACSEDDGPYGGKYELSQLTYTCTITGTYYVQISSYYPDDSGNYVLDISVSE